MSEKIETILSSLVTIYLFTTLMGFCLSSSYILIKVFIYGAKEILKDQMQSTTEENEKVSEWQLYYKN